ncbi:MAG: calcium/sodium antiporter [Spirochaetota bacterium]
MTLPLLAVVSGLILLLWSAGWFIEGAAATARYIGMKPLLIGMVVVGFGTSAPELVVSVLAALDGSPGIALGNAYGSNIANIALILGITALVKPVVVHSTVLRKELPVLTLVTALSAVLLADVSFSRFDAAIVLVLFASLLGWTIFQGTRQTQDPLAQEIEAQSQQRTLSIKKALLRLVVGLLILVVSSRLLVWGAVEIATYFGVSDMIIGLTIVAIGTSLPELASSIIAARRGEHDIALGNIIGSNLFNTLAVVGLAGMIHPFEVENSTLYRDMAVMGGLTVSLFIIGYGFGHRQGRVNRLEGSVLVAVYVAYTALLLSSILS